MSKVLDQIYSQLDNINKKQDVLLIQTTETKTKVEAVIKDLDQHDKDIDKLKQKESRFAGGWYVLLLIGSALISIASIVVALLK